VPPGGVTQLIVPATLAFAFLLPHPNPKAAMPRQRLAISLFTFAAVIFRSEVAILLATTSLYLLLTPRISLQGLIPPFAVSFAMALLISVPLDSYFWQKPLWPELWGFYYNAVLGLSSNWGIEPWYYYFESAATRLFVNPLVAPFLITTALSSLRTRHLVYPLVIPSLLFMAIYSLQPHKELRFIYYVVPPLTAAAAIGANKVFASRTKSAYNAVMALVLVGSVMFAFAASTAMLLVSSLNYPGGEALAQLHTIIKPSPHTDAPVSVHADVLSCMTGVTLFGTSPNKHNASAPLIALDKTEDVFALDSQEFWQQFDYLLVEDPTWIKGGQWDLLGVVEGYAGVELLKPGMKAAGFDLEFEGHGEVFGKAGILRSVRDRVRALTGGWWVGPRLEPKVGVWRKQKD
jgi:alpha-1,6-mannosyltransferase